MFFTTLIDGENLSLVDQEAQHCSRVLRSKVGDEINVMDGVGNSYKAIITEIGRNNVTADIIHTEFHQAPNFPTVAFGLIKNTTRMEWLVEKLTEIGVSTIIPIISARSERRHLKAERLQKVIVSASKQSLKYHLPVLREAQSFKQYIQNIHAEEEKKNLFIASYNPDNKELWEYTQKAVPSVILIGPEGDFSPEEVDMAKSTGAIGVNLGPSRLRAETAAIVACTHLNAMR